MSGLVSLGTFKPKEIINSVLSLPKLSRSKGKTSLEVLQETYLFLSRLNPPCCRSATLFSAIAGPYVNIELTWFHWKTTFHRCDNHIGFESDLGDNASWYIQGGPAIVAVDGADATTELSGKVGLSVAAGERTSVYGEVSGITQDEINFDEDFNVGVKLGVKIAL